jgi:DNA-binding MarR family transcriptional regulator
MELADLLTRTRAASDERQVIITLTPHGDALRHEAAKLPPSILQATRCTLDQVVDMKRQLDELRSSLMVSAG